MLFFKTQFFVVSLNGPFKTGKSGTQCYCEIPSTTIDAFNWLVTQKLSSGEYKRVNAAHTHIYKIDHKIDEEIHEGQRERKNFYFCIKFEVEEMNFAVKKKNWFGHVYVLRVQITTNPLRECCFNTFLLPQKNAN